MRNLFFLLLAAWLFAGCKKTTPVEIKDNCTDLKQGIVLDNFSLIKTAIDHYIDKLPSNLHTEDDLKSLAAYISANCSGTVVLCHACIYSYPAQSEIVISVNSGGTTIKKVVDIIGHPHEKMRFHNFHDL